MGIKGIYGEIGPGERVALSKLAINNLEKTGRPLKLAVDISIWQFQIQSGKGFEGGSNPALRTLYYRLLRFLSMNIQPLFVFDGSQKPPFKRNKRTSTACSSLTDFNTKQLLKLFGFPFHIAPGEAEAECALLQRQGIVDAVLSEDVDTLMFGCGRTIRNWSSEGSRGNHAPTHVTVYDASAIKEGKSGLDREGMILVALISGGDYVTEGIPGYGIKIACEAARAGFGKSLCRLSRRDTIGLDKWRKDLLHELHTNDSKYFRVKHKSLQIPETFPNMEVLGYYTHPVVSSTAKLAKLKEDIKWGDDVNVAGLRVFVAEAFDWTYKTGAKKFIRGLAPALLVSKVRARVDRRSSGSDDADLTAMEEMKLVKEICGRRQHSSTDGISELRLVYHPLDVVGLDLNTEADEIRDSGRNGLAPPGEDESRRAYCTEDESDGSPKTNSRSANKRSAATYDPIELQRVWVPEAIAKFAIPLMVEDYEESLRNSRKPKPNISSRRVAANGGMPKGALDRYITIVKPVTAKNHQSPSKPQQAGQSTTPAYLAPVLSNLPRSGPSVPSMCCQSQHAPAMKAPPKPGGGPLPTTKNAKPRAATPGRGLTPRNPYVIAQLSSPASQSSSFKVHISKPSITCNQSSTSHGSMKTAKEAPNIEQDLVRSSLASPSVARKHPRSPNSISETANPENSPADLRMLSPSKRFIPSNISVEPIKVAKQTEAAARETIQISSSPISAPRSTMSDNFGSSTINADRESQQKISKIPGKGKGKKFFMLRESLEGFWKEVGEEEWKQTNERKRDKVWRASAVEVLDMTGDYIACP